ncbi:hypothetical protein MMC07_000566 [Pseudocyphellaria aurata]|nr:hypothetical protein [Pseudocyphellaria aurata]
MAWEQLSVNKPHWAYLIIGGFTSLFMLCSLFVKEKLYIGEATVATICGVIFGPHAANLFNPLSWGNTDQITLECSRVVLVVQCFAIGVELPKAYMERHWRSVVFLLVPVMTYGWLVTSLFIWWMIEPLTWLESLMCAACVTATDPVLASSVVGKGKFAKRVPKHLRDLLSAESGCNDGMAFPFIYLSFYLIHYRPHTSEVAFHWFCNTILYECIFGAVYGVLIGYLGRHAIKWADRRGLIDRESFLVFYFVLALFCAGTGATLGLDDLLVGFAAGVGFSNDGWFTQKTEESHVSNVIDLLLNLAYFVYLGAIIPWEQYNAPQFGLTPWRLVVIAIFVIFFRRIPIMMALKPLIPDMKSWREALFAGHFGPIGVGAIFAAILARAELENDTTTPLAVLPEPGTENYAVVQIIWPLTTFLVITSILVHGSSIAVFTLGKRINTLTLTMSYTQADENGPSWMNRLPRIASTARGSFARTKSEDQMSTSSSEKLPEYAPGTLPPVGMPGNFLRRQKEDDTSKPIKKAQISRPTKRRKWDSGMGPGGPVSQSAIAPQKREDIKSPDDSRSDSLNEKSSREDDQYPDGIQMQEDADMRIERDNEKPGHVEEPEIEAYEEGDNLVIEDEEGNVLSVANVRGETEDQKRQHILAASQALREEKSGEHAKGKFHPHTKNEGEELEHEIEQGIEHPEKTYRKLKAKLAGWNAWGKKKDDAAEGPSEPKPPEKKRGPAHAYQYGNTIILEDEDGEVIEKYEIPVAQRRHGRGGTHDASGNHIDSAVVRHGLKRMGTWAGFKGSGEASADAGAAADASGQDPPESSKGRRKSSAVRDEEEKDDGVRFTVTAGGRRMSKADFIRQIQDMDPSHRYAAVQDSDAPEAVKEEARQGPPPSSQRPRAQSTSQDPPPSSQRSRAQSTNSRPPAQRQGASNRSDPRPSETSEPSSPPGHNGPEPHQVDPDSDRPHGDTGLTLVDSHTGDIPVHSVPASVTKYSAARGVETAAQRRRRMLGARRDSDDDGTDRVPPISHHTGGSRSAVSTVGGAETNAERRRRLAALGSEGTESDSDDDGGERRPEKAGHRPVAEPGAEARRAPGIRFADSPAVSQGRVQWGEGVGKKAGGKGK